MDSCLARFLHGGSRLFKVIAAGFQAAWTQTRKLEHQVQFSHQNRVYKPQISPIENRMSPAVSEELATAVGSTSPIAHG